MTNFYSKYLKYKKKYLMAKSNMRGGEGELEEGWKDKLKNLYLPIQALEDVKIALKRLASLAKYGNIIIIDKAYVGPDRLLEKVIIKIDKKEEKEDDFRANVQNELEKNDKEFVVIDPYISEEDEQEPGEVIIRFKSHGTEKPKTQAYIERENKLDDIDDAYRRHRLPRPPS